MVSWVLSKYAFSSAGITITKHWNCLKTDVIKALQGLKYAFKWNLIVYEPPPLLLLEAVILMEEKIKMKVEDSVIVSQHDNLVVLNLNFDNDVKENV